MMGLGGLLALLTGALAGAGLILLVVAFRGTPAKPPPDERPRAGTRRPDEVLLKLGLAALAGLLVLVATRWLVAAAAAAVMTFLFGPSLSRPSRTGDIHRIEALASWCESLRDIIAGAVGLEQAIPASLAAAGPAITPQLALLVERLGTRQPLPNALRRFADDIDDPSADLVIAALILNSRLRGPGLRDLLGALATSAREELDMRRRVESARRATRRSVRIVVSVSLAVSIGMTLLNHAFVGAYDSFLGQLVLAVIIAVYCSGFLWLRRLAQFSTTGRFLLPAPASDLPVGA